MSSHVLDLSGQREVQLTLNDPAKTRAFVPAKQGDDTSLSFGGREIRISLPTNARIQRRKYVTQRTVKTEGGRPKPNPDEAARAEHPYETEPVESEALVLVVGSTLSGFIRSSLSEAEKQAAEAEGRTTHEMHTHTSVVVRRQAEELHFLESGELVEEVEVGDTVKAVERDELVRNLLDAMARDAKAGEYSLNVREAKQAVVDHFGDYVTVKDGLDGVGAKG